MASQERGVSTAVAAFVIIIMVVVGTMGVISFTSQSGATAVSSASTKTTEQESTFYSTVSPSGLELETNLNATTMQSGSTLAAQITLFNSLDRNLSLVANYSADSTLQEWNDYDYFCPQRPIVSYALFQGNFASDNVSLGSPLQLVPPVGIPCVGTPEPDSITFLPENDSVVLSTQCCGISPDQATFAASTGSCTSSRPGEGSFEASEGLPGYWNTTGIFSGPSECQDAAIGSKYFTYFTPGEYTL
jgi:hypothetical protein